MINRRMIWVILSVIFIIGCEREVQVLPVKTVEESAAPLEFPMVSPSAKPIEVPVNVEAPTQAVSIQLEPRGSLKAPIKTVVADTPQSFTIKFREGMNRNSVEDVLRKTIKIGGETPPQVDLAFYWQNEKELNLTISIEGLQKKLYPVYGYTIDVNGALTSAGQVISETPTFRTLIQSPRQLWRISVTDGHSEKISKFLEPFNLQTLDNADYMLATQYLDYCECDMTLPLSSSIYNIGLDQMITYPVPLMTQYKGHGDFVADKRGFFYEQPKSGEVIPPSDTAEIIHVAGYVHGATFSHDRKNLILAIGQEKQEVDLDFAIYNLETKRTMNMPKKLIGRVPDSQVSSAKIPVQFKDDATYVYSYMINEDSSDLQQYRYSWSSGMFEEWKSPEGENAWNGFLVTDDGAYRYYYNGAVFRGSERITLPDHLFPYFWLKGTHRFVSLKGTDASSNTSQTLVSYNVDEHSEQTIIKFPQGEINLVGSSSDGRWVYVSTENDL